MRRPPHGRLLLMSPVARMETVLEPGMVFEVETPYYRLGVGGSFIEDTVVVTDAGPSVITTLSRDLTVL